MQPPVKKMLSPEASKLVVMLRKSSQKFRSYQEEHEKKNTKSSLEKAEINKQLADEIDALVSQYMIHRVDV